MDEPAYCYLTTSGRSSGQPHRIEIWFTAIGDTLYLISGGGDGSDWVQNLQARPEGQVEVGDDTFAVTARAPMDRGPERTWAVSRLHAKYASQVTGTEAGWERGAYIVALDRAA